MFGPRVGRGILNKNNAIYEKSKHTGALKGRRGFLHSLERGFITGETKREVG